MSRQEFDLVWHMTETPVGRLARLGGVIVAIPCKERARCWLALANGMLVPVIWPSGYRVRFDPVEVVDRDGLVVGTGGELVSLSGGWVETGGERSFIANTISKARSRGWKRGKL